MAALPVVNVSVRVVCGNDELKVSGSRFLNEAPGSRRIYSTDNLDDTLRRFLTLYQGTRTQFSLTPGDPARGPTQWVVTPRSGPLPSLTDIKGNSKPTDVSYVAAIRREFQEETGSDIPERYFLQDPANPSVFCLNIDPAGKSILDANFQALKPATETWQWVWQASTGPCAGLLVPVGAITRTNITNRVVAIKATIPVAPVVAAAPPGAIAAPPPYPPANSGESLNDYVIRVSQGQPPAAKALIRNYGRSKLGLLGGKTIRRKKLRRSKKRGTSKQGARR